MVLEKLQKELEKSDAFRCFLSTKAIELGLDPGEPAAVICFDRTRNLVSRAK